MLLAWHTDERDGVDPIASDQPDRPGSPDHCGFSADSNWLRVPQNSSLKSC